MNGIRGALAYLRARQARVQPELDRTSYFGFSFGGIITANMANRYRRLGLPKPRAIFLDDPHDGGLNGSTSPRSTTRCGDPVDGEARVPLGAEGVIAGPNEADASCNAIFPKLGAHPEGATRTSC